ncbi:hypothetical protein AK812_SmicGene4140 [Symbiodinium microadriaticum]|uniref:Methyltransferase FkbM domain-containing protein n=1 Tax=Symbiodinium microadriaticum TaxID=2951 RepID=A0A1Q9EXF8_SYMMI|nr:hypothetical protein AK812_SmicGene4140 [Symbiodinium microadriaticum]
MRKVFLPLAVLRGRGEAYDYVEIGTADFDTLAQRLQDVDVRGLSVEPVEEHLRRLPDRPKKEKVAAAIAEVDGWADLYVVRPEYMEPQCSNETVASLGLRYCLPWWFRATASLGRPSSLVDVHAAEKAHEAQMVVKVQTLTYRSLMERYNVTSLRLLKIDTEGLDALILRQMLRYGEEVGFFPDRVQFERNNLTDFSGSQQTFDALQAAFDCWIPPAEDDVHCLRLVDIAPSRPTTASGSEVDPPWVRVELPDRLPVPAVELPDRLPVPAATLLADGYTLSSIAYQVGDSRDASNHRTCGTLRPTLHGIAAVRCPAGVEGRFLTLTGTTAAMPQACAQKRG